VYYDFEVLKGDEIVAAQRMDVSGLGDVWSIIARMAETIDEPGCRIRVSEGAGRIAVMMGVAAARRMSDLSAPAAATRKMAAVPEKRARDAAQSAPRRALGHLRWRLTAS